MSKVETRTKKLSCPKCKGTAKVRYRSFKNPHFKCDHCGFQWDIEGIEG